MLQRKTRIEKIVVGCSIFSALAFVVALIVRVPVMFLTFDAKDAVITIAAFVFGPLAALAVSLVTSLLELVTIGGTGIYGFIMNFASSATFSLVASLLYRQKRTIKRVFVALSAAIVSVTAVMLAMNCLVTPYYMGAPIGDVLDLIPTVLLPFNFAKALLNASIVLLLYKPLSHAMKRVHLLPQAIPSAAANGERRTAKHCDPTVIVAVIAILLGVAGGVLLYCLNH